MESAGQVLINFTSSGHFVSIRFTRPRSDRFCHYFIELPVQSVRFSCETGLLGYIAGPGLVFILPSRIGLGKPMRMGGP